jgi:hypothetical protein
MLATNAVSAAPYLAFRFPLIVRTAIPQTQKVRAARESRTDTVVPNMSSDARERRAQIPSRRHCLDQHTDETLIRGALARVNVAGVVIFCGAMT